MKSPMIMRDTLRSPVVVVAWLLGSLSSSCPDRLDHETPPERHDDAEAADHRNAQCRDRTEQTFAPQVEQGQREQLGALRVKEDGRRDFAEREHEDEQEPADD